jgi:DNA-directed RNA polymerase specialized sigma24 family protein
VKSSGLAEREFMQTHVRSPDAATALLQRNYRGLRASVIGRAAWQLGRSRALLHANDFDQAYDDAWLALFRAVRRGRAPAEFNDRDCPAALLREWLATVTYRRAVDIIRATHPERFTSLEHAHDYADGQPALTARIDERETTQLLFEALRHRFSERDAKILVLTELFDVPRRDVAERLSLSLKRLHKLLDPHKGKAGLRAEMRRCVDLISDGRWCSDQASLLTAFRLGWFAAGSRKDLAARAHLKNCAACRTSS